MNSAHFQTVEQAINFICDNFREQPTLDEIAEAVHLSKYHFQRVFKEWAGISPKEFLQYITAEQAKKSLKEGLSTLETAYESGLSGNGRLHDLFVKIEACTPGQYKRYGRDLSLLYSFHQTLFGEIMIAETPEGINRISFTENKQQSLAELTNEFPEAVITEKTGTHGKAAAEFLTRQRIPAEKIVLNLQGTPFQLKVWKALLQIPPATLASYGTVAALTGSPGASRAVGSAAGKNPVACLIPCHRVIRQTGQFGEYHWGSSRKIALFAWEQVQISRSQHPYV